MSIASEVQRLQQAKTNIKTTLTNKGLTVPNTALISDYNTYINNLSLVKTGTITVSAASQTATISGLGFTPKNAIIFIDGAFSGTNVTTDIVMCASYVGGYYRLALTNQHSYCYSYNYLYNYTSSTYLAVSFSSGSVTFTTQDVTYGYFHATTYRYVVW